MNKRKDLLPVLVGGDFAAYSQARTFHEAYGVTSIAVTTAANVLNTRTSILRTIAEPELTDPAVFLRTMKEVADNNPEEHKIVLGCRDWQVRMVIENKKSLKEMGFIVPYIDRELLDRLVLKEHFYELCDKYGVAYPKTFVYDFSNTDVQVPDMMYPVIAKPSNSAAYYNTSFEGQKKVYKIGSREELIELLERVGKSDYGDKFLIQEFVPGDDTGMHLLTCYCDKNSKVRLVSGGHTMMEDHEENSIGNPVAILTELPDKNVQESAVRLLESIGYTGFANFDIKYDPRDGVYKFFEINTRLGSSSYYVTGAGYNTAEWYVKEWVDGESFDGCIVTDRPHLYSKIPQSIINAYVQDEKLRAEVDAQYKAHRVSNPIDYRSDRNLLHHVYVRIFMHRQKKRFLTYL
ncbi:MAG: hypothetical protein IJH43_03375 [Mogibacterium sp.]|nr:hypothetical protein [Mogibacterium sp.]